MPRKLFILLSLILTAYCTTASLAEPGVTDSAILIGSSLALTGPGGELGTQTYRGMMACINALNEAGGVHGRKIAVISYDDEYNPIKCVENTKKLIESDGIFALSCYVGTPTAGKAMPLWKNAKIPLVGFYTGVVPILRNPFQRYNIHIRASYFQETSAMMNVLVNTLNKKKIAVFYQYDSFGEAIKKDTETSLASYGLTPVAYGTFDKNAPDVSTALKLIKAAAPDAVVLVGAYGTHMVLAEFVHEAKKAGMSQALFYTLNVIGSEEFAKSLGKDSSRCIVSQVTPPYDDAQLPLANEYRKALQKYFPKDTPGFVGFEGFINTKILTEGLKKAGKEVTREGLIDAISALGNFDFGGIQVGYGPQDHEGMDKVYLTGIKDGKYYEIKDWSVYK
ncbi:MAG: hypothetical protein A2293_17105 [Elusimicrobia bacterium RIFOXYB2_FULL_49_7]|nr:MAG: hypothetical protein A2293_17105 [Elusimicrobia bacterium RIFOXYB2_FULL_49_7]